MICVKKCLFMFSGLLSKVKKGTQEKRVEVGCHCGVRAVLLGAGPEVASSIPNSRSLNFGFQILVGLSRARIE